MARILKPLDMAVAQSYIDLMRRIGTDIGVNTDDMDEILAIAPRTQPDYTKERSCQWHLIVHKRHRIDFAGEGLVFEIRGRSDTNKTFTLAYLGTLLGVDWNGIKNFLQDSKMMERSEEAVTRLSQGQRASLLLKAGMAELNIEVADRQSRVSLMDTVSREFLCGLDGTAFSLRSEADWEAYRKSMSQVYDVQVVAKRRNFVHQVGLDEGRDLCDLARRIVEQCSRLYQFLETTLPSGGATAVASDADLVQIRNALESEKTDLEKRIEEIRQERDHYSWTIRQANELVTLKKELAELKSAEEYARAAREVNNAERINEALVGRQGTLENYRNSLQEHKSEFQQLSNRLAEVEAALQSATLRTEELLPRLTVLTLEGDNLLANLKSKNIQDVLKLTEWPDFTAETLDVYQGLSEKLEGVSLSIPIGPITIDGEASGNVGGLRKTLEKARSKAADSIELRAIAAQLAGVLQRDPQTLVTTKEEYDQLANKVKDTIAFIETLQGQIESLEGEIGRTQELLSTILRGESLEGMQANLDTRRRKLPDDMLGKIQKFEKLAEEFDISDPWADQTYIVGTLFKTIEDSEQEIKRLEAQIRETQVKLKEQDNKIQELRLIVPESRARSGRAKRLGAIEQLKEIADTIAVYLEGVRETFESGVQYNDRAENARKKLGKYFGWVVDVLNQRIRERCPVRYVNRGLEISHEPVRGYDFIQGKPVLDLEVDEGPGGGEDTVMTVRGLAAKEGKSLLGTVLLVDEFGDAVDTFGDVLYHDLNKLPRLALAIFVDQQKDLAQAQVVKKV